MKTRAVIYRTADPAPWFVWNRYGQRTIGAAVRVARSHLLSVQWRRP